MDRKANADPEFVDPKPNGDAATSTLAPGPTENRMEDPDLHQMSLFDSNPGEFDRKLIQAQRAETWLDQVDSPRRYTKELVHLGDVPVGLAGESAMQKIAMQVNGADGDLREVSFPGKILHRHVPAPHVVRQNGKVVPRHQASHGHIEQVFMHLTTRVTYTLGVVTPLHYEIFLAVVYLWWTRYLGPSRDSSPTITTTRQEIAEALGTKSEKNGHLRREIPRALLSIKGLQVFKDYETEDEGVDPLSVMAGSLIQKVAIQGRSIEELYGPEGTTTKKRKSGSRSEQITITLGTELIDAILGKDELLSQAIAVRTLRLDQTVRHKGWKQGLYRMIELRLERHERFDIPLEEVWVQILGMSPDDPLDQDSWRQVRLKIRKCLREWAAIEYIAYRTSDRDAGVVYHATRGYSIARRRDGEWIMEDFSGGDWLCIERGAAFLEGRPLLRDEIEQRVLKAAGFEEDAAKKVAKSCGEQLLIDVRRRMKDLIVAIGDDHGRVATWDWFSPRFPSPRPRDVLRRALLQVAYDKTKGGAELRTPYPMANQRRGKFAKAVGNAYQWASDGDLARFFEDKLAEGTPTAMQGTARVPYDAAQFYRQALEQLLERHGRTREDFEQWRRDDDRRLSELWEELRADAARVGAMTAIELYWYRVIEQDLKDLPDLAHQDSSERFGRLRASAVGALKLHAFEEALADYRRGKRANEWTRIAASLMERRMVEAMVEMERLWPGGRDRST